MNMRLVLIVLALCACRSRDKDTSPKGPVVGLVTDVGGRGDQSFNDSALRGLEAWAANMKSVDGKYVALSASERAALVPPELNVAPLGIKPVVVQSKAQEDYQPNLQLIVDFGADLIVGVGFMLENSVEAVAKENPQSKFLLIDSPVMDAKGTLAPLPNVRTVVFKEEEGSFLVGALAGLVARGKVGFVGGMEIPLIKKFEAGFRAGVRTTNPGAEVLIQYTGSFDNVAHGKQAAQDLVAKGCEVIFHAAGSDGNGVIQAVKEARAAGSNVFVIGVDSDQSHLAPDAVLTSMVKRVDYAVWLSANDLKNGTFGAGDSAMGLKEGGVTYAPVRVDVPEKAAMLAHVEALRAKVVAGQVKVPSNTTELERFKPPSLE
ncbi:MAG: BMP family ABC transporter substrate-binding protein [Archangium gephyra]|uniref:BMP family ABC transporter substrate-binding protein n=1 Tax=Archangium gephyra TaxID=48 RepID=A0A2W5SVS1_9BACT|nr:MAG: BMP family ABC transporter substrate-binding protein [Archangium gephyra]